MGAWWIAELGTTSLYERAAQRLGERTTGRSESSGKFGKFGSFGSPGCPAGGDYSAAGPPGDLAFFSAGSGSPLMRAASSFAVRTNSPRASM